MDEAQFQHKVKQAKIKQAAQDGKLSVSKISDLTSSTLTKIESRMAANDAKRLQQLREYRRNKAATLRRAIERLIPPLYHEARLRDLNRTFRELLLGCAESGAVIFGLSGTGKTYALCALMRSMIASGRKCRRVGYERLCLDIRSSFTKDSTISELSVIEPYMKCDILILEDLGAGRSIGESETDFSVRVFYVLLNTRIENRRPTFISTNKSRENLEKSFDERIASRLQLLEWIGIGGKDRRKATHE